MSNVLECKPCDGGPVEPVHGLAVSIEERYKAWSPEFCHELAGCVVSAGWRPGSVLARPTREALGKIIWETSRTDEGSISVTGANIVADALLAADHLWAEQPHPTGPHGMEHLLALHGRSSAPVVDRVALADWLHDDFQKYSGAPDWDRKDYPEIVDGMITAGLFVGRATVEAEQREKDAQIAEHTPAPVLGVGGARADAIAAAIRAGGAS